MTTQIDPRTIVFSILEPMLTDLRKHSAALEAFNDLPNIPWRIREGVRTVEGHLGKVDELALDLADRLRVNRHVEVAGDPAVAFIDKMWPDDE